MIDTLLWLTRPFVSKRFFSATNFASLFLRDRRVQWSTPCLVVQSVEVSNLLTRAHFVNVDKSALLFDLGDLFEQIFIESELLFRHLLTTVRSVDLQSLQRSNSLL